MGQVHVRRPPEITNKIEDHDVAQKYEWEYTKGHIEELIKDRIVPWYEQRNQIDWWVTEPEYLRLIRPPFFDEFFARDEKLANNFRKYITKKTSLEIGSNVISVLLPFDWMERRVVIEPLADKIRKMVKETANIDLYENIELYSRPAEEFIPELEGAVDGMLYCRNCLDHTEVHKDS